MNRVDAIFADLRAKNRSALMPFITAGYPSLDVTRELIPRLEEVGAAIVEIGIPFSDPIADGPVIAASMHEALRRGVTPDQVFDLVRELRSTVSIGLVAMLSVSIIDRMGADDFVARAANAGIDGLIVPDIDTTGGEESPAGELSRQCAARGMSFSILIAPTTRVGRLRELCNLCHGFVYLLARMGLTGEHSAAPEVVDRVREIRSLTQLPIAVGFGISDRDHVTAVTRHADAAIVGSALIRCMGKSTQPVVSAVQLVDDLARGLASPNR